jgi:hypothetical protein
MGRRLQLRATYAANLCEVFAALCLTLAFRRWTLLEELPQAGLHYRYQANSVLRTGRVVDVIRPCGLTLDEVLHDPPCRVHLFLRWRIEPLGSGSTAVRLNARYGLNHAAALRFVHWDRRLRLHFGHQFRFIGVNLRRLDAEALRAYARNSR